MSNWMMGERVDEQLSELLERGRLECLRLLDSARFSTRRDSHLNGALTTVSILARPDRLQADMCRIEVICHSAGHLRVDWEQVPLELIDTESNRVLAREVLDSRGRSTFTLPYGTRERSLRFRDPVITLDLPVRAFALVGGGAAELPSSNQSEQLLIGYTIGGAIPGERTLKITVRALDPSLRGSTVRVEIRSRRSGKVRHSATVVLAHKGTEGDLEIREALLGIPDAGDLKIEAQPTTGGM